MTFWLEIGGQFWLIPQYRKTGYLRRVFWLFFGIGFMPKDFAAFLDGYTKVATQYGKQTSVKGTEK